LSGVIETFESCLKPSNKEFLRTRIGIEIEIITNAALRIIFLINKKN
jgi:hypothetical protein